MKFLQFFVLLLFGINSLVASSDISHEYHVSPTSYVELKKLCDLIVSAQLSPAHSEQLIKKLVHENDCAEFDEGAFVGTVVSSVVAVALVTALVTNYCCVRCCNTSNGCCNWFFNIFWRNNSISPERRAFEEALVN